MIVQRSLPCLVWTTALLFFILNVGYVFKETQFFPKVFIVDSNTNVSEVTKERNESDIKYMLFWNEAYGGKTYGWSHGRNRYYKYSRVH